MTEGAAGSEPGEAGKAVVARLVDLINAHDAVGIDALIGGPHVRGLFDFLEAYPDRQVEVEWMVAEGARVASWLRFRGTQRGSWFGVPPTGRDVDVAVSLTFEVEAGRLVDFWYAADTLGWLEQLGCTLERPSG